MEGNNGNAPQERQINGIEANKPVEGADKQLSEEAEKQISEIEAKVNKKKSKRQ